MAPINKSSDDRTMSCSSLSRQAALLARTSPNKWQCLTNSATPDTLCGAASTSMPNTNHASQFLQAGTAHSTNADNCKADSNFEKTVTSHSSSSEILPEIDSADLLTKIKSEVLVSESEPDLTNSIEASNVQFPPLNKKLSKRIRGVARNYTSEIQNPTTLSEVITPFNSSKCRKRKHHLIEQSSLQKEVTESSFSLANVKTEPEEQTGYDVLEQNLHSNIQQKRTKKSPKNDTMQENLCSGISDAAPSNSVGYAAVKLEPADEPLYEMPCTSSAMNLLAGNVKEEQDEEHSIGTAHLLDDIPDDGDSALAPGRKKGNPSPKYMISAYNIISNLVHNLHAPLSIIDGAFTLFNKVVSCGLLRGRPADLIASSCVYFVCRQDGVPRTFKEISAISNVGKNKLGRSFKLILKGLDTSLSMIKSDDFMCRFCHALGLGDEVIRAAECIAKEAVRMDLVPGRTPISVAAAAIYMAAQASAKARTALDISKVTGLSETTVVIVYRSIYPYAKELFPPNFKFRKSIENLTTTRMIF